MSYGGETDSKRLARYWLWHSLREAAGERFKDGPHLVLCSREAGDVSALIALGADPKGIFAVDTDADAISSARAKFPSAGVNFIHDDVANVAPKIKPLSAFLDFCGPICSGTARCIVQVAKSMHQGQDGRCLIAGGFMRGRDRFQRSKLPVGAVHFGHEWRHSLTRTAHGRRSWATLLRMLFARREFDPRVLYQLHIAERVAELRELAESMSDGLFEARGLRPTDEAMHEIRSHKASMLTASRTRLLVFCDLVAAAAPKVKPKSPSPVAIAGGQVAYMGAGVPMVYCAQGFAIKAPSFEVYSHVGITSACWPEKAAHFELKPSPLYLDSIKADLAGTEVRRLAVEIARREDSSSSALALNLPVPKVRAWLAHDTMGTYSKVAA